MTGQGRFLRLFGMQSLLALSLANPAPSPAPAPAPMPQAISSLSSAFASATGAAESALPSTLLISTQYGSRSPPQTLLAVLGNWPSLGDIEKKLGLSDSDLANISRSALLIPSYSNFTGGS